MAKISSGFIVRGQDGKYLLGKVSWAGKTAWSVFKGAQEEGESLLDTAIRELKEESGIDINKNDLLNKNISPNPIYTYKVGNKKDVYLYLLDDVHGVLNDFNFTCTSFWGDSYGNKKPEVIDFAWYDVLEIEDLLFPSQKGMIYTLKKIERKS